MRVVDFLKLKLKLEQIRQSVLVEFCSEAAFDNREDLRIEDVAKEVDCVLGTCRRCNAMRCMEIRSMEKEKEDREGVKCGGVDFDDVVMEPKAFA